jgi:CheY-like chemotaxis protein
MLAPVAANHRSECRMSNLKLKVLVADDSKTILEFFADTANHSSIPFDLIRASNGHQCMEFLNQGGINLAFIDVNMPEMSGMEAVGRARLGGIRTFVTLMSAYTDRRRLALARQLKVYEYLIKPFTANDIEAILKTYCRVTVPARILIVDDSATVRRLIQKVMNGTIFNIECEEAGNGEQALALCEGSEYDMIFLDCNMPGLDGLQTLERLLERDPGVKVVMISAERNQERTAWALDRGAHAFLHKPFYAADIDRMLHDFFGLRMPELTTREQGAEPATAPAQPA